MKYCFLDFEFHAPQDYDFPVVSLAMAVKGGSRSYWLYSGNRDWGKVVDNLSSMIKQGYVFVAYAMESEARCIMRMLESQIFNFKAIDLYLEYRNLLNHNHNLAYGKQLIRGKITLTKPSVSKWERTESDDDDTNSKPEYSLASACFKLLDVHVDTARKTRVREIIISGRRAVIESHKSEILEYNESDIVYLPRLFNAIKEANSSLGVSYADWFKAARLRGDYAVATARMVDLGYPINVSKVKKFVENSKSILEETIEECIAEAKQEGSLSPFRWVTKQQAYVQNQNSIQVWVEKQFKPYWRRTPKHKVSLSKEAFGDWYNSQSPGFAGAYCRYLKTKQSMSGFIPQKEGSTRKTFWDSVGSDGRVRPYFGIYGAQSSRSQPSATGFIPLKAHWMRNFIEPGPGRALAGIDFASQEFLISAIMSQDQRMISAYLSGDVYLAFGIDAGLIPVDGTKNKYPAARDICKTSVLGMGYDMTNKGLAPRIAAVTGKPFSEGEAQKLIDLFHGTYSTFAEWKSETLYDYKEFGSITLPDGWTMWGDNDNFRSAGNMPIQGCGAVIMREAVKLAQRRGLKVIFTLHDALYIDYPAFKFEFIYGLIDCMQAAFQKVMKPFGNTIKIRLEGETWSPQYIQGTKCKLKNVKVLSEYVDDKGAKDLARYRKYLT
jgi:hypothetical protein